MRKQKGGEISVPVMQSSKQLKQSLHEGIESGNFNSDRIDRASNRKRDHQIYYKWTGRDRGEEIPLASKKNSPPRHLERSLNWKQRPPSNKNDAFYKELSESEIGAELKKISEDIREHMMKSNKGWQALSRRGISWFGMTI